MATGLLLGAAVALTAVVLATGLAARLADAVRGSTAPVARWITGPGPRPSAVPHASHRRP